MWVKRTYKIFWKKIADIFESQFVLAKNLDLFCIHKSMHHWKGLRNQMQKKKCLKPSLCKWQKLGISRLSFKLLLVLHCLFSIQIAIRSKILKVSKLLDEVLNLDWVMHNGKKWQFCAKVNWDLVAFYGTFQKTPIFFFFFFFFFEK